MIESIFDGVLENTFHIELDGREVVPRYRPRDIEHPLGHDALSEPMLDWLKASCREPWMFCHFTCKFLFSDERDAAMFKVAWL